MSKGIRGAGLAAALTAVLIAGGVAMASTEDAAPSAPGAAPGMMEGGDQMQGMDGMMSMMKMMERMNAMMTACEKMMETTASAPDGGQKS